MQTTDPVIISASRRTDVPALHGAWFRASLDAGQVSCRQPFSGVTQTISLRREDVLGFVFWSKNFVPFLDTLDVLRARGYPFYCHYTITGLAAPFEPQLPPLSERLDSFREIACRFGEDCVIWRFDPLVLANTLSADQTYDRFCRLLTALQGATNLCVTSFVQMYAKVQRRFERLRQAHGIEVYDPALDAKRALLVRLADEARGAGISLAVCCQDELVGGGVLKAGCVDAARLARVSGAPMPDVPRRGARPQCGCCASRDIGTYNTCTHRCAYCYATT